jgi:hypothetical protein
MEANELRRLVLERIEDHRALNRQKLDDAVIRRCEAGYLAAIAVLKKADPAPGETAEEWAERAIEMLQECEDELALDPSDPMRSASDAVADAELEIRSLVGG